jgi:hypothetical protein
MSRAAVESGLARVWVLLVALIAGASGACGSQPKRLASSAPARPTAGGQSAQVANGFARWEYYFNRNAIAGSVAVGENYVALTEAGHLLRFDRKTFALTGQLLFAHPASAVGAWRGASVAVGFAQGVVSALDGETLTLTPLDTVPGRPVWLGRGPEAQLVIVYARNDAPERAGSPPLARHYLRVAGSKADIALPLATTFFIDSASRLWLGSDHGEWGGDIHVVDLERSNVADVPDGGRNVYGFAEPKPGEVWAHGGMVHMGMYQSYVTRLTPKPSRTALFETSEFLLLRNAKNERWLAAPHPHSPIVKIVQLEPEKLLLVGYGEVFETDTTLKNFRLVAKPVLHVSPGRPDAVGSYPAVRATHVEGDGIVLATAREGYVALTNGTLSPHALPNQMGCSADRLYATHDTLIVFQLPSCVRTSNVWRDVQIASWIDDAEDPPPAPDSDEAFIKAKAAGLLVDSCAALDPQLPQLLAREQLESRVQHCARDSDGRWWLAGEGLWFVTAGQHPIAVHPSLPFLTDTTIRNIVTFDHHLGLALGARGLAILDLNDLKPLASPFTSLPSTWTEHGP